VGKTVQFELGGETFEWWSEKSDWTLAERGFDFRTAAYVFFDSAAPVEFNSIDENGEDRYHIIGSTEELPLAVLFVVYSERGINAKPTIGIISARDASPKERRRYQGVG
jgi:uncharacterized DUF497 family protein